MGLVWPRWAITAWYATALLLLQSVIAIKPQLFAHVNDLLADEDAIHVDVPKNLQGMLHGWTQSQVGVDEELEDDSAWVPYWQPEQPDEATTPVIKHDLDFKGLVTTPKPARGNTMSPNSLNINYLPVEVHGPAGDTASGDAGGFRQEAPSRDLSTRLHAVQVAFPPTVKTDRKDPVALSDVRPDKRKPELKTSAADLPSLLVHLGRTRTNASSKTFSNSSSERGSGDIQTHPEGSEYGSGTTRGISSLNGAFSGSSSTASLSRFSKTKTSKPGRGDWNALVMRESRRIYNFMKAPLSLWPSFGFQKQLALFCTIFFAFVYVYTCCVQAVYAKHFYEIAFKQDLQYVWGSSESQRSI
ncbi:uncharacterized protein LOC135390714 [Ornithodoros turicata]|uniref:uncharacterized protein LOC135390714 n=1 Tax=Ornithodoros turicata TaxID=34597 RepID=UPI003138D543